MKVKEIIKKVEEIECLQKDLLEIADIFSQNEKFQDSVILARFYLDSYKNDLLEKEVF